MAQPPDPHLFVNIGGIMALQLPDGEKATLIFKVATRHDPCDPPEPNFVSESHALWAPFVQDMLSLAAATSFEQINAKIDHWRKQFYDDDKNPRREVMTKKRGRSSPTMDDEPFKAPRLDYHASPHPGDVNVDRLPPYEYVSYQSVSQAVARLLDDFQAHLTAPGSLLTSEEETVFPASELWSPPSEWEPRDALASAVASHVSKLTIPRVPLQSGPSRPDLLLYGFGSFSSIDPGFRDRLDSLKKSASTKFMVNNTSGSGKTKLLHDYSCGYWTLLLTCFYDAGSSPYGSQDVYAAFDMLSDPRRRGLNGASFVKEVSESRRGTRQEIFDAWNSIWDSNNAIAAHLFSLVLLARLLIYQRFREICSRLGVSEKRSRTAWCALQVCPHLSGVGDVFLSLFRTLSLVDTSGVDLQLPKIVVDLAAKGQTIELLVFDEAQSASSTYDTCFGPNFNAEHNTGPIDVPTEFSFAKGVRPVLKPLVQTLFRALGGEPKICVSGTKMSAELINEALRSSIGKQNVLHEVHQLGGQNTSDSILVTLEHFLGSQFAEAIQSMAVWKDVVYWLQGRHRFLNIYIQAVMTVGSVREIDLRDILYHIVSALTGHNVGDTDVSKFDFLEYHGLLPDCLRKPALPNILVNPQRYRADVVVKAMDCICSFLLTATYPDYPLEDITLVELGIARFDKPAVGREKKAIKVVVNEHIALLTLMCWLDRKPAGWNGLSPLQLRLQSAMSNPESSSKGFSYEDLVIYLLWNRLSASEEGVPLSDIFTFQSPTPPWADQPVQLVTISDLEDTPVALSSVYTGEADEEDDGDRDAVSIPAIVTRDKTTGLAFQADNGPQSMLALSPNYGLSPSMQVYQFGRPFLKPDKLFGPDIIFALRFRDGSRILVCVQCKCWYKGKRLHKAPELEKILWKLSPEGWYDGNSYYNGNMEFNEGMEDLKARFRRGNLEFPEPADGKPTLSEFEYDPYPVGTAVLRVFAAFPGTYVLPDTMTKQVGCYPVATLSERLTEQGCLQFSSFRVVADAARASQERRIKRAAAAAAAKAARQTPQQPGPSQPTTRAKSKARGKSSTRGAANPRGASPSKTRGRTRG